MSETVYRITQIEPQKHAAERFSIYLDGAFAFGLDGEVVLRHHLHEGDELSESVIDGVLLSEERSRAKKKALSLLARSARSVHELRNRLLQYEFSPRTVDRLVQDFIRVGLLDDKTFALMYARSRLAQRSMGKRFLKQELLQKGIDETLAESAVSEAYGSVAEDELARRLVDKKIRQMDTKDKRAIQHKLSAFLFRRGFNWDVIAPIVQEKTWETED